MRAIRLIDLHRHGILLTAHERVAIVHQVCSTAHAWALSGHPLPAPALAELSVSEGGELIVDPVAPSPSRPAGQPLARLIDELLPADLSDEPAPRLRAPSGTGHTRTSTIGAAAATVTGGDPDRLVLQDLFARAAAVVEPVWLETSTTPFLTADPSRGWKFFEPPYGSSHASASRAPFDFFDGPHPAAEPSSASKVTFEPMDAPALAAAVPPMPHLSQGVHEQRDQIAPAELAQADVAVGLPASVGDEAAELQTFADRAPAPSEEDQEVLQRASGFQRGWERRAALAGLAVNAALGVVIAWQLGLRVPLDNFRGWVGEAQVQATALDTDRPSPTLHPAAPSKPAAPPRAGAPATAALSRPAALEVDGERGVPVVAPHAVSLPVTLPTRVADPVVVDGVAGAERVQVSPDGRMVAFDLDRDGERGVFIAARDGTDLVLASGEGRAAAPSWSPDVKRLAFVRAEPDRPSVWNLWMRDLASGELTRLTSHEAGIVRGASWFPDGRRLCYSHGRTLMVLDVETRATSGVSSPTGRPVRTPSVSPDGRRVAFEIEGDGIWLLDVALGTMKRVVADPAPSELEWGPKGHRLMYFSLGAREWRALETAPRS